MLYMLMLAIEMTENNNIHINIDKSCFNTYIELVERCRIKLMNFLKPLL